VAYGTRIKRHQPEVDVFIINTCSRKILKHLFKIILNCLVNDHEIFTSYTTLAATTTNITTIYINHLKKTAHNMLSSRNSSYIHSLVC